MIKVELIDVMGEVPVAGNTKVSAGWLVLDGSGTPYRPHRHSYRVRTVTHPPRIYSTKAKALSLANGIGGSVVEVFYEARGKDVEN
jgi:hypothetical protein